MSELYTIKDERYERLFYEGEVIEVDDSSKSGILKVKLLGIDNDVAKKDLPPAYPLINFAFFRVLPKVGERVFVMVMGKANEKYNQGKRYWLGPSISSIQNINYDPFYYTASSHESDGWTKPKNISGLPKAVGTYAKQEEVAIYGRANTDIVLKENELIFRGGRHLRNNPLEFNQIDPAYMQIKYTVDDESVKEFKTITKTVTIDPEYKIVGNVYETSVIVKVLKVSDNSLIEEYKANLETNIEAIAKAKENILVFQKKYPKFIFTTQTSELSGMPQKFKNTKIVKEKVQLSNNEKNVKENSTINLVANKINILSHKTNNFKLTDPNYTISPQEQQKIDEKAHPLVYGDKLIEFINLVKEFIVSHVHPYNGMSPVKSDTVQKILNFDLNQIINENIRIN